ncbi:MAG TPA: alpha/beta fold hydrolase, partial [Dongiaceae bacterium]
VTDMAQAGFAIVATDYHGLGTDGRHRYMDRIAQANDIINSIPAARQARAEVGSNWVASGHSQGGLAAWTVAELQAEIQDATYKGAVAVAPATHLPRLLDHPEEAQGAGYYFAWHAFAIEARYPEFKAAEMLSEIGLRNYQSVTSEGCWLYGLSAYAGVDDVAMLRPGWSSNKWVRKFYRECTGGTAPARGPILVVAGEGDTAVPIAGIRDAVEKGLKNGQSISLKVYPGLDHDPAMMETLQDQIAWIRQRLSTAEALPITNPASN